MKNIIFFLLCVVAIQPLSAQEDDCNPNLSAGNSWLESKRKEYGPNCTVYMLNRAVSTDFNGAINVSLGGGAYKPMSWMDEFKQARCNAAGGCWTTTIRQSYRGMQTYHNQNDVPIYSRPLFLENTGTEFVLTSYSTPIDTTWLTYNDKEIAEYIEEIVELADDMSISLTKYSEEGKVYYKAVGVIPYGKKPIEPSNAAELIAKFGNGWMYNLIDKVNNVEIEHVHALLKKKHPYYKKKEFENLMNFSHLAVGGWFGKEGTWNFTRQNGKKNCLIENDGNVIRMLMQVKVEDRKLVAVAEKMKQWAAKNPFEEAQSTEVKKYGTGNWYWIVITIDPSQYTGEDFKEDVYAEFFGDYGDEFVEEVDDAAEDIK